MLWSFQRKRGQTDVRVTLDFFTETLEARRPWNKGFKILKENDLQTSQGFHRFASSVPFLLKLQEGKHHPNKRVNPGGNPEMERTGDPQRRQAQGDSAWRSLGDGHALGMKNNLSRQEQVRRLWRLFTFLLSMFRPCRFAINFIFLEQYLPESSDLFLSGQVVLHA